VYATWYDSLGTGGGPANTAVVSFTAGTPNTATRYEYYIGLSSATPAASTAATGSWTTAGGNVTGWTWGTTTFYVSVRAVNSSGSSAWTTPVRIYPATAQCLPNQVC